MHIPLFRIFYSTTFTVFFIILLVLLLIAPGDGIYQAQHSNRIGQALTIGGVYILTALIMLLIYSVRLYTTRTHLSAIPKPWIPIRKGDVSRSVQRMIVKGIQRSASIAYEAHPRDLRQEWQEPHTSNTGFRPATANSQSVQPPTPIWGTISHPGWSSPSSPDLPNLHFLPVILELPHLIEAKAVSLAPLDPLSIPPEESSELLPTEPPLPDALAVELLQRPATMGLRDYIAHLNSLSLIQPQNLGAIFLSRYERARFSEKPLVETDFRQLMSIFADILRGIEELDPAIVGKLHAEDDSYSNSDVNIDSDSGSSIEARSLNSTDTMEHTPFHTPVPHSGSFDGRKLHHEASDGSIAGSEGTVRTAPSRAKRTRDPSRGTGSAKSRRQTTAGLRMASSKSLQKAKSKESASSAGSGASVIRLAENAGPLDLPYVVGELGEHGERT
ncbi:hypothetical protein MMC13_000790 [Lambiella insularis]|nr:hypothetical protein [Lambiella insularis]